MVVGLKEMVGATVGVAVTGGATRTKEEEIYTVLCELVQPPQTVTVVVPELGITKEPGLPANLLEEQLPPVNLPPAVSKLYSAAVEDNVTVSVSPKM